jgi:adenylylsulfate kinase
MSDGYSEARNGTYFKDRSLPVNEQRYYSINDHVNIWFIGLPQAGKSTLAQELADRSERKPFILDGDVLRTGLNSDLKFSPEDRTENLRRAAEVAKMIYNLGYNVFSAFITPTNKDRELIKSIIPEVKFVWVRAPLSLCEERDTRGMYKLAREGKIKNFTGIDAPFEIPDHCWTFVDTEKEDLKTNVNQLIKYLNE